jgi:hypothetical protein
MNTRDFTRFEEVLDLLNPYYTQHLRSKYIHAALVRTTSFRDCAIAARLSHESWARSEQDADIALMGRLIASGDEHAKALRGFQFTLLIEAPIYWWVEMDTYNIGVIKMGSTSTMHKEAKKLKGDELVRLKSELPGGTLNLRMLMVSWHTLVRIIEQRGNHRLPEWRDLCGWLDNFTSFIDKPGRTL